MVAEKNHAYSLFVPCASPAWYKYGVTLNLLYLVLPHIMQKGELASGLVTVLGRELL